MDNKRRSAKSGEERGVAALGPRRSDESPALENDVSGLASLDGLIEVYGRHEAADCWVFVGWMSRAWSAIDDPQVTAVFQRGNSAAEGRLAFYERGDLGALGVGFVLVVLTPPRRLGKLVRLELKHAETVARIVPSSDVSELPDLEVADLGKTMLVICEGQPNVEPIGALLSRRFVGEGYVDSYGYHAASMGWFVSGWLSNDWIAGAQAPITGEARFEGGSVDGEVTLTCFERQDILGKGMGVILHVACGGADLGRLATLTLRAGRGVVVTSLWVRFRFPPM